MFKKFFLFLLIAGTLLHATSASRISLTELYIATFDRAPDAKGLQYWLDSGWDIEAISKSFFDQKETQAKYPNGFSSADFVEAIYKNLFDRDADTEGFEYWLKALKKGEVDRSHFILATMNGALGDDAKLLNNKVIVGLAFVKAKKDNIDQARAVVADVTQDVATVTQALSKYKLDDSVVAPVVEKPAEEEKTNTSPEITTTAPTTATEDVEYSYSPTATDEENNTITWTISGQPTGMSINSSTGKVTWTPTEGVTTSGEVTITATDNGSPNKSTTESFTITVTAVNNAPEITTTAPTTATEDVEYSYSPTATDEENNTITWTISGQPTGMSINSSTGKVTWTPTEGVTTSGEVTITATDNGSPNKSTTESFTITVTQVNDKPIADSGDDQSNVERESVVTLDGSGSSDEDGDTLTYSWTIDTKPTDSTATLSNSTVVNPTFTPDKVGTYTLSLVVNDGTVDSESDSVTITVVDTTSPTLAITDDISDILGVVLENRAWRADSVTFTFTFSESVTGFTAEDITVSNGSKGAFSGSDDIYTLVVTPTATINEENNITVSVPSDVAKDAANNPNEGNSTTQEVDLEAPFITVWETDNNGSSDDNQIMITIDDYYDYNYTIDWGDGKIDINQDGNITHTYETTGEYTIKITGDFPHFLMQWVNNGNYTTDNDKLLQVKQWGTQEWQSMATSFISCSKLDGEIIDDPNLENVADMSSMFDGASTFNQPLGDWNVSNVTYMIGMFSGASAFNQDISGWDVSNVTYMIGMFAGASTFNQDISGWDVSNVTYMSSMFSGAHDFNGSISNWTVSSVTDMSSMFSGASKFNQPLNWGDKTSKVTDMSYMFFLAEKFNQDISGWTVSNVTNMSGMFSGASAFDQDISGWTVSNVTNMSAMFNGASKFNQPLNWGDKTSKVTDMSSMFSGASAFDQDISGWDVSSVTNMSGMFNGAHDFNGSISNWTVSSVSNMSGMFSEASAFDQDISDWDVSSVTDTSGMFHGANRFNQPLTWGDKTSEVTDMSYMFCGASAFNQDISGWTVSNVTNMSGMFAGASAFNQDISGWPVSNVTNMSGMFAGASAFTNQNLSGWTVTNVTDHTDFMKDAGADNQEPSWSDNQ